MERKLNDLSDATLNAMITKAEADRTALKEAIRQLVLERDRRLGEAKLAQLRAALNLPSGETS